MGRAGEGARGMAGDRDAREGVGGCGRERACEAGPASSFLECVEKRLIFS